MRGIWKRFSKKVTFWKNSFCHSILNKIFTAFQVLGEDTTVKSYKIQQSVFFSCCFTLVFISADIIFYGFLQFYSIFIWKEIITNFPFKIFSKTPHPLKAEQPKSTRYDESFLLMFLEYNRSYLVELPNLIELGS